LGFRPVKNESLYAAFRQMNSEGSFQGIFCGCWAEIGRLRPRVRAVAKKIMSIWPIDMEIVGSSRQ
jgi:hypothetical protein